MSSSQQAFADLLASIPADQIQEFKSFVLSKLNSVGSTSSSTSSDAPAVEKSQDEPKGKKAGGKKSSKPKVTSDIARREEILDAIIESLQQALPVSALSPDEEKQLVPPNHPDYEGMDSSNTFHVDNFLYDENAVDDLGDQGKIPRNYCSDCGSKNIVPMNFISHSLSREVCQWIYGAVLGNLAAQVVVDVGSRLGGILYTGHLFSNAKQLIGIEINPYWVGMQRQVVDGYELSDRVQIIQGDVIDHLTIIENASVVCAYCVAALLASPALGATFLHNVFEWFCSEEEQRNKWRALLASVKKGTRLVTCPPLETALEKLGLKLSDLLPTVQKNKINYPKPKKSEEGDEFFEDCRQISMYTVY